MFAFDHFRACVARRATLGLKLLVFLVGVAKSKIDNFDRIVIIDQNIFRFKVSMSNTHLV